MRNFGRLKARFVQLNPLLVCLVIGMSVPFSPVYAQQLRAHTVHAPAAALVVPVVASVQGALGTYFRTDLHIVNHLEVAQEVQIHFYAAGQEFLYGDPKVEVTVVLPSHSTTTYEEVVRTLFGESGMGSVVINPAGWSSFKPEARLSATYRTWTLQPGGSGTMSHSSDALDMLVLPGGRETRAIIGARLDANFRCNVGIFNYGSFNDRSFLVTARSHSGSVTTTVKVPAISMVQVPLPSAALGYITVTVEPLDTDDGEVWVAYASSIDNRSGDSWLQNASPSSPIAPIPPSNNPAPGIVTYQSASFWQVTAVSETEPSISYTCPGRLTITEQSGSTFKGSIVMESASERCRNATYGVYDGQILPDGAIKFQPIGDDYDSVADILGPDDDEGPYCELISGDLQVRGTVLDGTLDARAQLTVECPIVGRRDLTVRLTGSR